MSQYIDMNKAVADALGWEYHSGALGDYGWGPKGTHEMRLPLECTEDAIVALEATRELVTLAIFTNDDGSRFWWVSFSNHMYPPTGEAATLCEAACLAIIAWFETKEKQG